MSPRLSVQPPVEKHGSCLDSHLGSRQRSLNCVLQGPTNSMREPGTTSITMNKTKKEDLLSASKNHYEIPSQKPSRSYQGSCLLRPLVAESLTNSYKGLFFRTGCRKLLDTTTASAILKGTRGIIKINPPGKTQRVAQMLFIHKPHVQVKMSITKDIQVKTVKLNMHLGQNADHFWEGPSEAHHVLSR